jgi:hypothetical protein
MKRNLFALFGSVAALLTATGASITASAQTSGTELIAQTPTDPTLQQQDQTIQERALVRLQAHAEEEEDFLNILD